MRTSSLKNLGAILFAKYAFAPNKLRYCGPDANRDIFDYCVAQQSDQGLVQLLEKFEGAYPYLEYIAEINEIKNPFDARVVEAYWIGNQLLNNVTISNYYKYLRNRFKDRLDKKTFDMIFGENKFGSKPHHSFHVLSGFAKKQLKLPMTLNFINNCLINCGKVCKISNNKIIISYQPIIYQNKKLIFGKFTEKEIINRFSIIIKLRINDIVSFHWDSFCDKLSMIQYENLRYWNQYHLDIINKIL